MIETFIGIDPDSNGAVAIFWPATECESQIQVTIWSLSFVAPGEVDLGALRKFLYEEISIAEVCVYLERQRLVFIPPKQKGAKAQIAVKTSVTLAKIEYAIRGLLAGMNIPMESVPPGSWKKAFVHGKEPMLPVASRLFPSVTFNGNAMKREGQATALMLAKWGSCCSEGTPK